VFGGSWGSTLALAYAQTHPERCLGLILRGIFLLRRAELSWFYQDGASWLFPEAWQEYLAPIPEEERGDLMAADHRRLLNPDPAVRLRAARAWSVWEGSTSKLRPDSKAIERFAGDTFAEAFARIECHYFVNGAFLRQDTQLLDDVPKIAHLPGVIVQGRYDVVCPMMSAWDLHKAWPEADFRVVPDAGHSAFEKGIVHELITATDRFCGKE
jgi:proline iminopeptidase